jgi:hypothetical protein
MAFPPAQHFLASGQNHGVPTQFHVQVKGVAATTPDLVNSPFSPNYQNTCLYTPQLIQITISGVPSLSGLPLVAG